jgi:hypothetical protein
MREKISVFARRQIWSGLVYPSLDDSVEETLQPFNEQGKK